MKRGFLKDMTRPSMRKLIEGLGLSDYNDDSVPADVKPTYSLPTMEEREGLDIFINMTPEKKDEFKLLLAELFKHLQNELKLKSVPSVYLKSDQTNAEKILGKTGYYNPQKKEIVLFIVGRHPKDILRSFSHEVIHHWQHENEKFNNSSSTDPKYAQNDPWLRQMEKQAYLLGNIIFRDFEDNKKEQDRKIK